MTLNSMVFAVVERHRANIAHQGAYDGALHHIERRAERRGRRIAGGMRFWLLALTAPRERQDSGR